MAGPVGTSAASAAPEAPARMPTTRALRQTIRRARPLRRLDRSAFFTSRFGRSSVPPGAPRRHQPVEARVHDEVAVVVHVVRDCDQRGRPALHALPAPALDQLEGLLLGETTPDLGAVIVARPQLLQDLVTALEGIEAVVARERLAGDAAEEGVVLADQVDQDLPDRPHRGSRLEVVLVLGK